MPPLDKKADKKYTYQEYLNWNDGERWEIIYGVAYKAESSIGFNPDDKGAQEKFNKNNDKKRIKHMD